MIDIAIDKVLNWGLHDSEILEIIINFPEKTGSLRLKLSTNKEIIIRLEGIKVLVFNELDFLNNIYILDYKISKTKLSFFTTLSEWVIIKCENTLFFTNSTEILNNK